MEPEAALKTLNTLRAASSGLPKHKNQMKHSSSQIFLTWETFSPPRWPLKPPVTWTARQHETLLLTWWWRGVPGILGPVSPVTKERSLCGWSLSWLGSDLTYVVGRHSHNRNSGPFHPKLVLTKTKREKKIANFFWQRSKWNSEGSTKRSCWI